MADWADKAALALLHSPEVRLEDAIARELRQAYLRGEREREAAWAAGHAAATERHRIELAAIRDRLDQAIALLDQTRPCLGDEPCIHEPKCERPEVRGG